MFYSWAKLEPYYMFVIRMFLTVTGFGVADLEIGMQFGNFIIGGMMTVFVFFWMSSEFYFVIVKCSIITC